MECTVATENVSCYCLQSKLTTPFSILIDNHTLHSVKYEFYLLSLQNQDKKPYPLTSQVLDCNHSNHFTKEAGRIPGYSQKNRDGKAKQKAMLQSFFSPQETCVSY